MITIMIRYHDYELEWNDCDQFQYYAALNETTIKFLQKDLLIKILILKFVFKEWIVSWFLAGFIRQAQLF